MQKYSFQSKKFAKEVEVLKKKSVRTKIRLNRSFRRNLEDFWMRLEVFFPFIVVCFPMNFDLFCSSSLTLNGRTDRRTYGPT